jgi:hypothetical protein
MKDLNLKKTSAATTTPTSSTTPTPTLSHSTIAVDDNIHCSRVINLNFLLLFFSVDLYPVKSCKKNILMAQLRWHVAIALLFVSCATELWVN